MTGLQDAAMTGAPLHNAYAHDVITTELVACTLGHRRRPELRTDWFGDFHRFAATIRRLGRTLTRLGSARTAGS